MSKTIKILLLTFIVSGFFGLGLITGCNTDVITPPPVVLDTNIHLATLTAAEPWDVSSLSGINFYDLKLEITSGPLKDAQFYDSLGERTRFQIRTGDMVKNFMGLQTKFDWISNNYSKAQFDTLSKMYYDHTVNPNIDFPYANTDYYTVPLANKPVWSFYLIGRYAGGFNQGKRVYGMFQIDSLYLDNDTFRIRLNIKINKNETDQFNPYHN
ncbi:MAG TPA: hypothetical protein VIK14_14885 [Ignavibacteria bacterium]